MSTVRDLERDAIVGAAPVSAAPVSAAPVSAAPLTTLLDRFEIKSAPVPLAERHGLPRRTLALQSAPASGLPARASLASTMVAADTTRSGNAKARMPAIRTRSPEATPPVA